MKFYNPNEEIIPFKFENANIESNESFELIEIAGGRKEMKINKGYMNKRVNFLIPKNKEFQQSGLLKIKGNYFWKGQKREFFTEIKLSNEEAT